jgi:hypothetical protein
MGHDEVGGAARAVSADAERDMEVRQLLAGRNARRVRRGEAPQDVEAEFAALMRPPANVVDDELREEIRQHVLARNARRVRAGHEPLDIEREIVRRIRDLS